MAYTCRSSAATRAATPVTIRSMSEVIPDLGEPAARIEPPLPGCHQYASFSASSGRSTSPIGTASPGCWASSVVASISMGSGGGSSDGPCGPSSSLTTRLVIWRATAAVARSSVSAATSSVAVRLRRRSSGVMARPWVVGRITSCGACRSVGPIADVHRRPGDHADERERSIRRPQGPVAAAARSRRTRRSSNGCRPERSRDGRP